MPKYIFRGSLCGTLCGECWEPLARVKVRLYSLRPEQDAARLAVADPKSTLAVLDEAQVAAKASSLLGEFDTDDAGNFTAELGDGYDGGAFEIDVYCGTVPHMPPRPHLPEPLQFSITTLQPQWREREDALVAAWQYCLPPRFWCHIRGRFDAWVICGRVTVCRTGAPAESVHVFAFDRDWLQDDPLGSGLTDAGGHFRIYYSGTDFRRGTFINVELFGGPDVYFRIETVGGDVLLAEPPSEGRAPGRENIGPCYCVDLCVEQPPTVRHAWFTRVGDFNIYSDIDPATGLTNSAQPAGFPGAHGGPGFGFWGNLKLVGDCPTTHPSGGQPMRYRFTVTPSAGGAKIPITGPGLVEAVKVGTRPVPWNFGGGVSNFPQDIYVAGSGGYVGPLPAPFPLPPPGPPPGSWGPMPPLILQPDPQGWVTMPPDATNQGFSGPLIRLISASIAPGGNPPAPAAGSPVPPADQRNGVDFQITFEAEPITGPSPTGPTLTNALDRIHINNWLEVAAFDLQQFDNPTTGSCTPITNAVDIRYTMDHELVADWQLGINTAAMIPGGTPVLPGLSVPPVPPEQHATARGGYGHVHLDTTLWPACSYAVYFSRRLKLTDGEIDDSGRDPYVAIFCKD